MSELKRLDVAAVIDALKIGYGGRDDYTKHIVAVKFLGKKTMHDECRYFYRAKMDRWGSSDVAVIRYNGRPVARYAEDVEFEPVVHDGSPCWCK